MEEKRNFFIDGRYDTLYCKLNEYCSICGRNKVSFIFFGDGEIEKICASCLKDKRMKND